MQRGLYLGFLHPSFIIYQISPELNYFREMSCWKLIFCTFYFLLIFKLDILVAADKLPYIKI